MNEKTDVKPGKVNPLVLQELAIEKFGLKTQLEHALEELTELSLEIQKVLRFDREHGELEPTYDLACEFCDVRNALTTVQIFLRERYSDKRVERIQERKNNKFARIIGVEQNVNPDLRGRSTMCKSKCVGPRKVKDLVSLEDCFIEIGNALNYWYPLESDGATERECGARHDRLFSFCQKLRSQLEANAPAHLPGETSKED